MDDAATTMMATTVSQVAPGRKTWHGLRHFYKLNVYSAQGYLEKHICIVLLLQHAAPSGTSKGLGVHEDENPKWPCNALTEGGTLECSAMG